MAHLIEVVTTPRIVSLSYDSSLMANRSSILRSAGYQIVEADSVDNALRFAMSDNMDVLLICHTVPKQDQCKLILSVRAERRLMPILCVIPNNFAMPAEGSFGMKSGPIRLVEAVRDAVEIYSSADAQYAA